jgi:Zn finger protein HypA/HybF involved in hydrogenase expression
MKFKPSKQRKWTDTELISAVANNTTIVGILRNLGLSSSPGNYKTIRTYCSLLSLDTSHINGQPSIKFTGNARLLKSILIKDSDYTNSSNLRIRLIKENLLKEICSKCGLGPIWQNESLVLQLEHKNGDSRDHRLENLCLLCPNCHSQTKTYSRGWKNGIRYKQQNKCCDCGKNIDRSAIRCISCHSNHQVIIEWPDAIELEKEVMTTSYRRVAEHLGVTDNAIRKYLNRTLGRVYRRFPKGTFNGAESQ